MLRPLWKTKPDTAIRLRGQIEFDLGDYRWLKPRTIFYYGAESCD